MHGIEWDLIPSKSTCKTQRMLQAQLWETTHIEYGYARRYMPNGRERSQAHQHSGKLGQANQQGGN